MSAPAQQLSTAPPHPVVRMGAYWVHARMARGGMADLFLATRDQDEQDEVVALKRIRREFAQDSTFLRMFWDEARITGALRHPNIARLLDFGGVDRSAYLVFEFVSGVNLKTILEQGPLPTRLAAAVGKGVAQGLHAAHEQRDSDGQPLHIVHRDVTPMNIMVAFNGDVKLLDFGIALARGRAERTQQGVIKGKWSYLSPEQVLGRPVDRRADIFTLGAVIHEMVSGKRAFEGDAPLSVMEGITSEDTPPRLDTLVPDVPPELPALVARCMKRAPDQRIGTAREVADLLASITGNQGDDLEKTALSQFVKDLFPERLRATEAIMKRVLSRTKQLVGSAQQRQELHAPQELTDESAAYLPIASADGSLDDLGRGQNDLADRADRADRADDTEELEPMEATDASVFPDDMDTEEVETIDVHSSASNSSVRTRNPLPAVPHPAIGSTEASQGATRPELELREGDSPSPKLAGTAIAAFAATQLPRLLAMLFGIILGCAVAVALWFLR